MQRKKMSLANLQTHRDSSRNCGWRMTEFESGFSARSRGYSPYLRVIRRQCPRKLKLLHIRQSTTPEILQTDVLNVRKSLSAATDAGEGCIPSSFPQCIRLAHTLACVPICPKFFVVLPPPKKKKEACLFCRPRPHRSGSVALR